MFNIEELGPGDAGSVVVVDFQRVSSQPRLGELLIRCQRDAGDDRPRSAVHQVDPVQDLGSGLSAGEPLPALAEIAAAYARLAREAARGPEVTVVGDCSSAALALRVAAELEGGDRGVGRTDGILSVRTLLHRPAWPEGESIRELLAQLRTELGVDASDDSCPELRDAAPRALTAVMRILSADLTAFAARHEVDPKGRVFADLLARYRGWLGYVLAARDAVAADPSWFRSRAKRARHVQSAAELCSAVNDKDFALEVGR